MLYVAFVNLSNLAPVSDYEVNVYVNSIRIAGPFKVVGHQRDKGWQALVEKFIKEIDVKTPKLNKSVIRKNKSKNSKNRR